MTPARALGDARRSRPGSDLRPGVGLDERLVALDRALDVADGRVDPAVVARGRAVVEKARGRLGLGLAGTVVALAGATGSGKSSLFNALSGVELSPASVRRPTTGEVHACTWGDEVGEPLLDWLGVARRHRHDPDPTLDGLVLLDLPDHDSTAVAHHLEVDRLVAVADLLVWVLDPQKYADAAVHDRYLRPLAGHAPVMVVVLNQVDRLDAGGREACLPDLRRLLEADGLAQVPLLATSTRTGEGLDGLRAELALRVSARRAALERLSADVAGIGADLAVGCGGDGGDGGDGALATARVALVGALSQAAGADVVADAVAGSHRARGVAATGWPFTRWLRRLRPDPLRRLHLGGSRGDDLAVTSLPSPTPIGRARAASALRDVGDRAAIGLEGPWPSRVRRAATAEEERLPDLLDGAVAGSDLGLGRPPRWWGAAGGLHLLLAVAVVVGALWLALLFGLAWLQLPDPPLPRIGEVPLPTALLLGGALAGVVVAFVCRRLNAVGAGRRARRARFRIGERIGEVADRAVLEPVRAELAARSELCAAAAELADIGVLAGRR